MADSTYNVKAYYVRTKNFFDPFGDHGGHLTFRGEARDSGFCIGILRLQFEGWIKY
jgi:hypothetical protein